MCVCVSSKYVFSFVVELLYLPVPCRVLLLWTSSVRRAITISVMSPNLRRHTMAMYGCWPRLNENSTRYRLAIPSDTERAWYEDRVMREREARSGQRDVSPAVERLLVRVVVSVRVRDRCRRRGSDLLRPSLDGPSTERGRERTPPRRPAALVLELSPPKEPS